jgi:hypothetical protein
VEKTGYGEGFAGASEEYMEGLSKRRSIESIRGSHFSLPKRRKKADVLDLSITLLVKTWWVRETRVSPCRRDNRRKHLTRNIWIQHHIHLLMETLVMPSHSSSMQLFVLWLHHCCYASITMDIPFGFRFRVRH